jgi:hypothetical protein
VSGTLSGRSPVDAHLKEASAVEGLPLDGRVHIERMSKLGMPSGATLLADSRLCLHDEGLDSLTVPT